MKVRKGDTVRGIRGKDRGKKGKILRALPQESRVIVEGANIIKRHLRARPPARQAGVVEREAPIHVSDVMLLCPKCSRPARMGSRFLEDGKEVRVCRACGEVVE